MNSNLTRSSHIASITVTANQRVNLIYRSFVSRDINLLVRAFITYVDLFWSITQLLGHHTTRVTLNALRRYKGDLPDGQAHRERGVAGASAPGPGVPKGARRAPQKN